MVNICSMLASQQKKRLDRLVKTKNTVSLLEKYGYTEEMAYQLCKKYDLLSPMYDFARRGGAGSVQTQKKKNFVI